MFIFRMITKVFFLCFFFLTACVFRAGGGSAAWVSIVANPFKDDKGNARSLPAIIYTDGGEGICRPGTPDSDTLRNALEEKGLLDNPDSVIFDLFDIDLEGAGEGGVTESQGSNRSLKISVGENWLKFGLQITNAHKDLYLIVTGITFSAVARYKGRVVGQHSGNISPGYCGTKGALYLVSPGGKIEYKPTSQKHIFSNLTLYLTGFPIIDRKAEPSRRLQAQAGETAAGGDDIASLIPEKCFRFIPEYTVELSLTGYFITQNGRRPFDFQERAIFRTRSSLPGC